MVKFKVGKKSMRIIILAVSAAILLLSLYTNNSLFLFLALIITLAVCIKLFFIYEISNSRANNKIQEQSELISNKNKEIHFLHKQLEENKKAQEIEHLYNTCIKYTLEAIDNTEKVLRQSLLSLGQIEKNL
ncbi:MAG: hypothetical protein KTV77_03715 [Wolbachia endosymbiont of Fragariocoptes setiger]|nr:hypothetical protein [Wolbachia endosymbiont of Fragariocoptes setiger]